MATSSSQTLKWVSLYAIIVSFEFAIKFTIKSAREINVPRASTNISDCCKTIWYRRVDEVGEIDEKAMLVIETIKCQRQPRPSELSSRNPCR